jgi:hypothetical protein
MATVKIVICYLAGTNPQHSFFQRQYETDQAAQPLDLVTGFSSYHADERGAMALAAVPGAQFPRIRRTLLEFVSWHY